MLSQYRSDREWFEETKLHTLFLFDSFNKTTMIFEETKLM